MMNSKKIKLRLQHFLVHIFHFLLPFLKKYFKGIEFLDPAEDIAIKISKIKGPKSTRNSLSIYTTESPKALQRNLKNMGISNKVNLFS